MRGNHRGRSLITRLTVYCLAAALLLTSPGPAAAQAIGRALSANGLNQGPVRIGNVGGVRRLSGITRLTAIGSGALSLKSAIPTAQSLRPAVLTVDHGVSVPGLSDLALPLVSANAADYDAPVSPVSPVSIPRSNIVRSGSGKGLVSSAEIKTTGRTQETVVSRLAKTVFGIPRLLGLKGSALKRGAGRAFEGESRSRGQLITPIPGGVNHQKPLGRSQLSPAAPRGVGRTISDEAVETVSAPAQETLAPRQKISRALRIGGLTAVIMLALDVFVMAAATAVGYDFAPSYQMPALSDPATFAMFGDYAAMVLAKAQALFSAAWVAPLNEEVYFRAGIIGLAGYGALRSVRTVVRVLEWIKPKFSKLRSWIVPVAFGIAATEAAMFFALLHEMSDPILITVRVAQALLLSYLYVREGLVSGMVHHAVFNGLAVLTLPLISVAGAGAIVLIGPSFAVAAVLGAAAYLIWKFTRSTAKSEAREMSSGRLAPYRLSARGSSRLGRLAWASVAVLIALAAIQPTAVGALMIGAMAAQLVPAAVGLLSYGFLLKNLKRRKGAAAVAEIRNPKGPLTFGNRQGAWVAGVFGAIYLGIVGGMYLMSVTVMIPGIAALGVFGAAMATAALPLLILGVLSVIRFKAGKKGISPWLYVSQFFFGSMALFLAAVPWILPALLKAAETVSASGMAQSVILPTLMATLWTIPVFIGLAVLMTLIGRRIMNKEQPAAPETHPSN